jgi:hypothetical protein
LLRVGVTHGQGRSKKKEVRGAKLKIKGGLSVIFKIFIREGLGKKISCRGPAPLPPPLLTVLV